MSKVKEFIKKNHPIAMLVHAFQRRNLKNKDFTLFAPNCWGGIVYHIVKERFRSPLINMRFDNIRFFLKFLSNIDYYLKQEIRFVPDDEYPYPIGYLDDVKIHFVHYHEHEEIRKKWKERIQRINWNNVYIMATDFVEDDESLTTEELLMFSRIKCKNIIIFTQERHDDIPYCQYIGNSRMHTMMYTSIVTGLRNFEWYFDCVKWLNSELS